MSYRRETHETPHGQRSSATDVSGYQQIEAVEIAEHLAEATRWLRRATLGVMLSPQSFRGIIGQVKVASHELPVCLDQLGSCLILGVGAGLADGANVLLVLERLRAAGGRLTKFGQDVEQIEAALGGRRH